MPANVAILIWKARGGHNEAIATPVKAIVPAAITFSVFVFIIKMF